MKRAVYYGVTLGGCALSVFLFWNRINLTPLSVLPLALIGVMLLQIVLFKGDFSETGFRTAYGSALSEREEKGLLSCITLSMELFLPLLCPFVLFFSSGWKLLSLAVYVLGLVTGSAVWKIRHGGRVKQRLLEEAEEKRRAQEQESMGKKI